MVSFFRTLEMRTRVENNRKSGDRLVSLIKAFLKVLKKDSVPAGLIWYQQGEVRKVGTQNVAKWMETLDQDVLEEAMIEDKDSLINGDEPLVTGDEDGAVDKMLATNLSQRFKNRFKLEKLPVPLSLMSKREKVKYVSDQIWREHRDKQVQERMVYGKPGCRPSFWPQDYCPWESFRDGQGLKLKEYKGPGTFSELLETCIRRIFTMHGENPETFVKEEQNKLSVKKKLSSRGFAEDYFDSKDISTEGAVSDELKSEDDTLYANEDNEDLCVGSVERELIIHEKEFMREHSSEKELVDKNTKNMENNDSKESHGVISAGGKDMYEVDLGDVGAESAMEENNSVEESPVSITISSKGHEPIQITLNTLKRRRVSDY